MKTLKTLLISLFAIISLSACNFTTTPNSQGSSEPEIIEPSEPEEVFYEISWVVEGETIKKDSVKKGDMPVYEGETPVKEATAEHTFSFSGWTPEIVVAVADASYTAVFSEAVREYTIIFMEGEEEVSRANYPYGTIAEDIVIPEKEVTEYVDFYYVSVEEDIVDVTEDATYHITYIPSANKAGCTLVAGNIAKAWGGKANDGYWETYGIMFAGANFGSNYSLDELMTIITNSILTAKNGFTLSVPFAWDEEYEEYDAEYYSLVYGVYVYASVYNNGTEDTPKNTMAFQVAPLKMK